MKTPPQPSPSTSTPPASPDRGATRAPAFRIKEIARLVPGRMEERKRNASLPLWNQTTLGKQIGWSKQTIRDDINDMKALGYPIKFDTRQNGYVFTEKFTGIPTTFITESELTLLLLGFRAIESLKGSPFFAPVDKALRKLAKALTEKLGIDMDEIKSTVTFRSTGVDPMVDLATIDTLMKAILKHEELEIVYSKLNYADEDEARVERVARPLDAAAGVVPTLAPSANPDSTAPAVKPQDTNAHPAAPWLQIPIETRKAQPLHVLCMDGVWYLYLWDPKRKAIRRFTLNRMHSITRTGSTFKPRKFDLEEELKNSPEVTSGEPVDVRILFRRKATRLVAERPLHRSQKLAPGPDPEWNLELTMRVAHTPELEREIIGYDQDAKVIEPAELRDAILSKARGILANGQ
jgi:predicted DNA-binding transcriptional regulator YafY